MPAYTTTVRYHRDGDVFLIRRQPWWTYLVHAVIVHGTIAFLCFLTGHRCCNIWPSHWAIKLSDRHSEDFEVPADRDLLFAFERWRGWRDWDNGGADDTSEETEHE